MTIQEIIELYENVVIQIATPYTTGTGFYLKDFDVIVTNEHVVRDNREVVIKGRNFEKQMSPVVFLDALHDLAFVLPPSEHSMPKVSFVDVGDASQGDSVIAVGHPFGLNYMSTQGIISNLFYKNNDINYVLHDAALNPGNSGGPLLGKGGKIVGVNTFVIKEGNNIGFSLPSSYLTQALADYSKDRKVGVRCNSCKHIVPDEKGNTRYCSHCGAEVRLISDIPHYEPLGINRTIESMLEKMGFEIDLSRKGPNNWLIKKGSATINISYHEKTGLIIADAYLCTLPESNIADLYTFLLKENYKSKGLTFSVKEQDIILSILIFDQYLNIDTGIALFEHLFQSADDYDDILIDKFKAKWKN